MDISALAIKTIRVLGLSAITQAKSGHGGIVLGAAPIMYALFHDHLKIDVTNLKHFNRDRFILSSGHGSALLYAMMIVAGYKSINVNDLKVFRQLNSKTSGHPENAILPGVEVCTGPLGQGAAMSVGFAISERFLHKRYQVGNGSVVDHYTYVLLGDGDLEEGVAQEAMAIAGKQRLNKLIWIYDSNRIQLDGKVSDSTDWNLKTLCKAYHWNYLKCSSQYSVITKAITKAKRSKLPTLIEVTTTIGETWQTANSNKSHGLVLSAEELEKYKKQIDFNYPNFVVPPEVKADFSVVKTRGQAAREKDLQQFKLLKKTQHKLANEYLAISKNQYAFKNRWFAKTPHVENEATRNIVGNIIQTVFTNQPTFITVNPDLSSSTKIIADGKNITSATPTGKNLNIGVREFVGADIVNGIVAHGGTRAVCATFLSFSDYNKAAVRLGAISQLPILNVYTHDSITVGEDGPTHQPIEQIPALRLIPNHYLFRPANFAEALFAIKFYLKNKKSAISIISSRSAFKQIVGDATQIKFGGYCLIDQPEYDLTIIATGSEVGLADEVIACLAKKQIKARLVSMPCVELFRQSPLTHQNAVLGNKPRISLEFAATAPWYEFVDYAIGIDQYGYSAKPKDLCQKLELTPPQIAERITKFIKP